MDSANTANQRVAVAALSMSVQRAGFCSVQCALLFLLVSATLAFLFRRFLLLSCIGGCTRKLLAAKAVTCSADRLSVLNKVCDARRLLSHHPPDCYQILHKHGPQSVHACPKEAKGHATKSIALLTLKKKGRKRHKVSLCGTGKASRAKR